MTYNIGSMMFHGKIHEQLFAHEKSLQISDPSFLWQFFFADA